MHMMAEGAQRARELLPHHVDHIEQQSLAPSVATAMWCAMAQHAREEVAKMNEKHGVCAAVEGRLWRKLWRVGALLQQDPEITVIPSFPDH